MKDDTASYDLGGGQTLTVTALAQGFSENITLTQQPDSATSYRIPMDLQGLKLSQADSGHLLLKDSDGKLVAEASAPMMWDSTTNDASGEPEHQAQVATKVETADDGKQTLVLTPDADFLAAATYPVTVDPTSTLAVTTDTWVQTPDYLDSQIGSQDLKSGTYDSGSHVARSFLKFDVSKFKGKHITDTNLGLYSYYSSTCSTAGAGTRVRRVTSDWSSSDITWGAQPTTTTVGAVVNTGAWGYSSSCSARYSNWDIDDIVQAWADGLPNYGLRVNSADESDSLTWRRYRSANYTTSGYAPKLTVTYNSYATTSSAAISPSAVNAYNGKRYVTTYTPTLSAKVTDADGSTVKGQFEVTADPAYADTTYSYTGTSSSVASGSTAKLTVPSASAFPADTHLRFRVRGYDGTDYGSWSGYTTFVLNTGLPAAPTIVCNPYAQDVWTATSSSGATCTLDTASSDGQGYYWGLDNPSAPNRINDTTDGNGGDPLTITIKPGEDWHALYAATVDSGGNISSATTKYSFGVGTDGVALLTPGNGDSAARRASLTSTGKTSYTGATYQYRRGETDSWQNISVSHVVKSSDGSAVAGWPVTVTDGAPAALTWNVTDDLTEDGPIDVRVVFTNGTATGYSEVNTFTLDRDAGTAPSREVGPGEVNLLTGDFTISAGDVSAFDLSESRTASSRRPAAGADAEGQVAIFGPQWTSGVTADLTESDWAYLRKTSDNSVALVDVDGAETGFTRTDSGGWTPQPGAENLTLTGSLTDTTGSFTLQDTDGTKTTFNKPIVSAGDPAPTTWQVSSSYLLTDNSTTKIVSEAVTSGTTTLARPKLVISPTTAASADNCQSAVEAAVAAGAESFTNTTSTAGCRILQFVYATTTTATDAAYGDYKGQVRQIKLWAMTPGAGSTTATPVAQYTYDSQGQLRQEWDPRLSTPLKTTYDYDAAGRITTVTPSGELAWTFVYDKAGNTATAGSGMLLSASRPTLTAGTKATLDGGKATTSIVYDVPLSGSKAPNSMAASDVAAWGQADNPVDATAVFPADAVPASHTGSDLASTDYTRATIAYADASGREVNTAAPGGHIVTTEYDRFGNTTRQLDDRNRRLALGTGDDDVDQQRALGIYQYDSARRAQLLSAISTYDGPFKTESYDPIHMVTLTSALKAGTAGTDLPAGSEVAARQHAVYRYDEGRPTDGSANVSYQLTSTTTGISVPGYPADTDLLTTATVYDWTTGLATKTVTDPDGLAITKTTAYDSQGRVVKTTSPKSDGTDADTTVTTYYSATGTGTCKGRPEWADMLCSTGPAATITGGGSNPSELPTKTVEYDRWGDTAKVTETANSVTRTTTTDHDDAGRIVKTAISGGVGTAVPDTTTTYDSGNGQVATVTSNGQTITTVYDTLGRRISYADGAGNTVTTAYDGLDRPVKTTDSAPSTTTYTYDTSIDPRGLETSRTDSVAGTFSSTYDANADLATESLPGGYTLTIDQDETGTETSRTYTRDSDGTVVASDTATKSIHGQTLTDTNTNGQTVARSYTYDAAGRSTRADDTASDGSCTRRDYTFDKNINRTALADATGAVGTACSSTDAATTTSTYDSADRLTTTGTVYDAFGRTTTQASGTTIGYYANDQVRGQTAGAKRQTWTLDAAGRLAAWTTESQGTDSTWTQTGSKVNHYGDDSDSPDWTAEDTAGTITRDVLGPGGNLVALTTATGSTVLQLTDLHGDVTVQLPVDTSQSPNSLTYDEYGNLEGSTTAVRYGWLGAEQRSADTVTGSILMGARLYDTSTGRFLSTDPEYDGSFNAYEYCHGDSVDCADVSGRYGANRWGCGATVDRPHRSHTNPHVVNVHAALKCTIRVPLYSIHVALYRSRWWGWEQMDTGYDSGANKARGKAVANWAPHGTCYYYLAVGDFMIAGGNTKITSTVYNYDSNYLDGKDEMCIK